MRERNERMDVAENQVWPPLQENPRQTDISDDDEEEEEVPPNQTSSRPSSKTGNLPMKYGLTFEEWKAKKTAYQPPKRAHFSRRDVDNRQVHARVAKVGVRKEPIPLQTRGRLRPAWDERFVLDTPSIDRSGSKTTVVRRKDSYEHTMIPTSRPTTAPSSMSSPVYTERQIIPTQTTHTDSSTTQATNTRGTSPLPSSRQSIDSFQPPRFSLRTTNPVYRRTSRSTSPVYSPSRKGDKDRNGFIHRHHRTSFDLDNQENHSHHHHGPWNNRDDYRDHGGMSHDHHKTTNKEIQTKEMIQSIVHGRDGRNSTRPEVVVEEINPDEDMIVEYTQGGGSCTRATSPIDERIVRLLLNDTNDVHDLEGLSGAAYGRPGLDATKKQQQGQMPSVEHMMESMARVMEAVSGIITNPPNVPEKRSTTPWSAKKQGIGSLLTPGGGASSTPKSAGGRGGGNVSMGGGSRYGGTPISTTGISAKDHAHELLIKELDRVKHGLTPRKSPGTTMNASNRDNIIEGHPDMTNNNHHDDSGLPKTVSKSQVMDLILHKIQALEKSELEASMVLSRPGSVIKKRSGTAQGAGPARESLDGLSRLHVSFLEEKEEEEWGGGSIVGGSRIGGGGRGRGGIHDSEKPINIFPPTYVNELGVGPGGRLSVMEESSLWVNQPSHGLNSLGHHNNNNIAGGGDGGGGGKLSSYATVTQRDGLLRMDTHPLIVTDSTRNPPTFSSSSSSSSHPSGLQYGGGRGGGGSFITTGIRPGSVPRGSSEAMNKHCHIAISHQSQQEANQRDVWYAPHRSTTHETTKLGSGLGLGVEQSQSIYDRGGEGGTAVVGEEGRVVDVAAMERAQRARDRLPRLLPSHELSEEMRTYRKELMTAREMREAPYRVRGLTLAETVVVIADSIAMELADEAADEVDNFVEQYAEKFLAEI